MNTQIKGFSQKNEELPKTYTILFKEIFFNKKPYVQVFFNGQQVGNTVNDNAYENDFYRYHDIFHFTFAAMLGWSPCLRSMLKRKRKSNPLIDEVEDGARAAITEEAISLIIFNEAKRKDFFNCEKVNPSTLEIIKGLTDIFEVKNKSKEDWENAILKAYELFRLLVKNNGGEVHFDVNTGEASFKSLAA